LTEPIAIERLNETIDTYRKAGETYTRSKKQIVLDYARSLECKLLKDRICKDIVHRLSDKRRLKVTVSEYFIRECLPEEYKDQKQSKNAKKQKHLTVPPLDR
jgi:hypothetical protein